MNAKEILVFFLSLPERMDRNMEPGTANVWRLDTQVKDNKVLTVMRQRQRQSRHHNNMVVTSKYADILTSTTIAYSMHSKHQTTVFGHITPIHSITFFQITS